MRKLLTALAFGSVLASGGFAATTLIGGRLPDVALVPPVVEAAAPTGTDRLDQLMRGYHRAVDDCRGSYPDDPAHRGYCAAIDQYERALKQAGCRDVMMGSAINSDRWQCPGSVFGDQG
jgi:hypothetical protein